MNIACVPFRSLVLLALVANGCRTRAAIVDSPPRNLEGTVSEVVTQLGSQVHAAVVVDPAAHELAECAHIRVLVPANTTASAAAGLAALSVRSLGLTVNPLPNGWLLTRDPSVRAQYPRECRGHLPAGADPYALRPEMPVAPAQAFPAPPLPANDGGASINAILGGITQRAPGEIDVTPAARDALFENMTRVGSTVRIIPQEENGAVVGMRLYGIRRGTVYDALGFQNGDTLRELNGVDIASPERALEAYSRLRNASIITATITRRGAPMELHYRLTH